MFGEIKYSGEPARAGVITGYSVAMLKTGAIGIYVRLLRQDYRLPDEISIKTEVKIPVPDKKPVKEEGLVYSLQIPGSYS